MTGAAALVPPYTAQPEPPVVWYTATPLAGSATAETSAIARFGQVVAGITDCQLGLAIVLEQPDPVPWPGPLFHTVSVQPRDESSLVSVVPPIAVVAEELAGYETPA